MKKTNDFSRASHQHCKWQLSYEFRNNDNDGDKESIRVERRIGNDAPKSFAASGDAAQSLIKAFPEWFRECTLNYTTICIRCARRERQGNPWPLNADADYCTEIPQ